MPNLRIASENESMNYNILYPIIKTEITEASFMNFSSQISLDTSPKSFFLLNLLNHGDHSASALLVSSCHNAQN
jgi:hypothetical protein